MNIRCPECQTTFRVDPSRIPPSGTRARCSRCRATFAVAGADPDSEAAVTQPGDAIATAGQPETRDEAKPSHAVSPDEPRSPEVQRWPNAAPESTADTDTDRDTDTGDHGDAGPGEPNRSPADAGTRSRDDHGDMRAAPSSATGPAPVEGAAPAPVFGSRDPGARAQRIARALVSDIVAYHPKRRNESLEAGTLRVEFRDEIMKSWEEYVAQVGLEMAKSTPYFREALNAILARGQAMF